MKAEESSKDVEHYLFYGQYYKVPVDYVGRKVWTRVRGETLFIESGKKVMAEHQIKHDRLDEPM
jgi:hypothetical protein